MREKGVAVLPGIGPVLRGQLQAAGFHTAYNVLGRFLMLDKNQQNFNIWIKTICPSANAKHANACYNGLNAWCNAHL